TAYVRQCDPAIAGQHGHDQTFKVACKLVKGFALSREDALRLLRDEYNPRCVPPWIDRDLEHKVDDALKQPGVNGHMLNDARAAVKRYTPAEPPLPSPPQQPDPAVYYGLIGQLIRLIEPHSETDPIALLVQALVAFGSIIGRTAHFVIEGDTHFLNLFVVLVGPSSKSRKGSSWGHVFKFFKSLVPEWATNVVKSGLSSGEGLIWAIRDAIWKTEAVTKKGVKEYVE